jgi:hypothetical protein
MVDPLKEEIEDTEIEEVIEKGEVDLGDTTEIEDDDKSKTVEAWMVEEDESGRTDSQTVPLGAHIKAKHKLRGTIQSQQDEIDRLKAENNALKSGKTPDNNSVSLKLPERPKRNAFDSDEAFETALDKYYDEKETVKFNTLQQAHNVNASQAKEIEQLETAVNSHYDRAEKLITSSGITPDAFKAADSTLREAIEIIRPGGGDMIADKMIAILGEGSEKVFYKLGNPKNKALRGELINILATDPSGLRLAAFLGEQKALLTTVTTKRISKAPPPDGQHQSDADGSDKAKLLKRQYDAAHKANDISRAWAAKKKAKQGGSDVSKW